MLPAPITGYDEPNVGAVGEYNDGKLSEDDSDMMIMMRTSILMQQEKAYLIF